MYRYVWLPADINDHTGSFTIDWHDVYTIDTKTGKVTYPEGTVYEAEHGVATGSAYSTICVGDFNIPAIQRLIVAFSAHLLRKQDSHWQ